MLDIKVTPQTTIKIKKSERSSTFVLQNNSMESVGYKIKTTRPYSYIVRPNMGIMMPVQRVEVEVTLLEGTEPNDNHKFLIEVYKFDWRKSIDDFKAYLKTELPKPVWTSRIGIKQYEEKEWVSSARRCLSDDGLGSFLLRVCLMIFSKVCFILNVVCLLLKFFE